MLIPDERSSKPSALQPSTCESQVFRPSSRLHSAIAALFLDDLSKLMDSYYVGSTSSGSLVVRNSDDVERNSMESSQLKEWMPMHCYPEQSLEWDTSQQTFDVRHTLPGDKFDIVHFDGHSNSETDFDGQYSEWLSIIEHVTEHSRTGENAHSISSDNEQVFALYTRRVMAMPSSKSASVLADGLYLASLGYITVCLPQRHLRQPRSVTVYNGCTISYALCT